MSITLDQVQALADQLDQIDQVRLVQHLAAHFEQLDLFESGVNDQAQLIESVKKTLAAFEAKTKSKQFDPWSKLFATLDAVSESPLLYPNASATLEATTSRR